MRVALSPPLMVAHGVSFEGEPVGSVENLQRLGDEFSPRQMRTLARALLAAADECDAVAHSAQLYGLIRREYSLAGGWGHCS